MYVYTHIYIHTHTQRYTHSYKQAMKTGKHENKPQILANSSKLILY